MKKRLIAAALAVVVVFSVSVPVSLAVTPADPLIASALYSFLLSAGYKLFRDGGIDDADVAADTLVRDLKTLYNEYMQDTGTIQDWGALGQGVSVGSSGNFLLSYDTALGYQAFADWLATKNSGANTNVVLISGESGSDVTEYDSKLTDYELEHLSGFDVNWTVPVYTSDPYLAIRTDSEERDYTFRIVENEGYVYKLAFENNNGGRTVTWISTEPFKMQYVRDKYPNQVTTFNSSVRRFYNSTDNMILRPNDGSNFLFYSISYPYTETMTPSPIFNYVIGNDTVLAYIALAGERTVEPGLLGDLIGRLSGSLLNNVHDLSTGQALSISVGAEQGTDEEEITGIVAGEFALPSAIPEITAVATPVATEGVTEPYPQPATTDIESLGLPSLGQALTSRFPFCIPFDVVSVYKSLNATAVCPVINVDLFPASFKSKVGVTGNTSFTIDFGDQKYSLFIQLIHWGSLVGFIIMLAFATKRLIWTTGG